MPSLPNRTPTPLPNNSVRLNLNSNRLKPQSDNFNRRGKKNHVQIDHDPPRGGHFCLSIICLARDLIVDTGISFRAAAAALALITQRWHLPLATPSFTTIRSWILRLGRYALCRPLDRAVAWVWLIDHTVQIGNQKLFVILGCPLANVPFGQRSLCLADLQLIALVPMESSTHEQVTTQLQKATERTATPRLIVSDHGGDLKKGIEQFQKDHAETAYVHDVAHHGANVLENRWEGNPRWHEFLSQLKQTNLKLRQTSQAYLLSPGLRPKARFMNVSALLRFAQRVQRLLDGPSPDNRVEEKYGWLRGYREELNDWLEQHRVVQTTIDHVRRHGVNAATESELERSWGKLSDRPGTRMVAGYMRVYARKYGGQARPGETLVGSTDTLESSFGKLKRLEGEASRGGFTAMVLALGALTGEADEASVRTALEEVPEKKAEGWFKRTLGPTVGWLRRQLLGSEKA